MTETALDRYIPQSSGEIVDAANRLLLSYTSHFEPLIAQAESMTMEIDSDPVAHGLAQFNQKLSLLRANANQLTVWLTQALAEKRKSQSRVKAARIAYDNALNRILSEDPEIAEEKGQQAKMALGKHKLAKEALLVDCADRIYTQMVGYYEALKLIHNLLADTKRDLMSQLAVVKSQISIGEVDGANFPINRGEGPATSRLQQAEQEVLAELGQTEGMAVL